MAQNCRSAYRCRADDCHKKHNTLLHEDRTATTTPSQAAHQTNSATHTAVEPSIAKTEHLLMTSQVVLTGPSGISLTARTLLDSGSTLSILSTKVMKTLSLKKTGSNVTIEGVGSAATPTNHPMAQVTLSSNYRQNWKKQITIAGMDKVTRELPLQGASSVRELPHLKHLVLADDKFDQPGRIDLLLGQNIWKQLFLPGRISGPEDQPDAWHTVFGWTMMGSYTPDSHTGSLPAITHLVSSPEATQSTDQLLAKFWELEEPSIYDKAFIPSEVKVEEHYKTTQQQQKRYMVCLPKRDGDLLLGESKTQAMNRAKANERSLLCKQTWPQFQNVIQEYLDLGHAQLVSPAKRQQSSNYYYMPVHAVYKASSTTTKIRAVFDASAKSTSQLSLSDLLAVGPTLHPTLDQILIRFRLYTVAISGDITKMYREVLLHPDDRSLHRFIWRSDTTSDWQEYQMNRVTFGVAASPYLAVKTLQQTAQDFGSNMDGAKWHLLNSFYVDDLMGGADTVAEATTLYNDLRTILSQASFQLKKWRSSSSDILKKIPTELQESLPTQDLVDMHSASYPKALGVAWDSRADTMATHVDLPTTYASTKRGIVSNIARTFDVLGWLSPAILPMKLLYRELWQLHLDWDEEVTSHLKRKHQKWREELHILAAVKIPRHYFRKKKPLSVELHGYCDASQEAYAAVVYIRATYTAGPPSSHLVVSKTRVAPLNARTIPQLELCGAQLLATLLTTTRQTLNILLTDVHAYCDSTIVLAWLDGSPQRYKIYTANRIASTVNLIPPAAWKHVPTHENPADAASRGLSANDLKNHHLRWHGPPWLLQQPIKIHPQPTSTMITQLQETEAKPQQCAVTIAAPTDVLEERFSSYSKLLKVVCRIKRLALYIKTRIKQPEDYLNVSEEKEATDTLIQRSQSRSFPKELALLRSTPPKDLPAKSTILVLHPYMDEKGMLRLGERLGKSSLPEHQKHPLILSSKDLLTKMLFRHYHLQLGHCGPSALLSHAGNLYHVVGARRLSREVCSKCVTCRAAAAKATPQLIGQLPPERVDPDYVFFHTGIDFAGPFQIKQGNTRKPVILKAHLAIFICFCTKVVHLELVSDMTTNAFIAALDRFVTRRGLPLHLYSDNGPNFTGAKNRLTDFYQLLGSKETQNAVQLYAFDYEVTWHTIPERAPHFGGLWEAAVKAAKYHLKRIVGRQIFTFEELTTICCKVESFLNSRPLGPITSHDIDGLSPLTPSYFFLGRAARVYPRKKISYKPTLQQRWVPCQQTAQHFWDRNISSTSNVQLNGTKRTRTSR